MQALARELSDNGDEPQLELATTVSAPIVEAIKPGRSAATAWDRFCKGVRREKDAESLLTALIGGFGEALCE